MTIDRVMTSKPATCGLHATLADAARVMWADDCGSVPVVDDAGRLYGLVTDRDICIASATRNRAPSEIGIADLIGGPGAVATCRPDDPVTRVLALMRERQVRRVPVTSTDGTLVGIVSINDLVLEAGSSDVKAHDVLETLRAICVHRQTPVPASP